MGIVRTKVIRSVIEAWIDGLVYVISQVYCLLRAIMISLYALPHTSAGSCILAEPDFECRFVLMREIRTCRRRLDHGALCLLFSSLLFQGDEGGGMTYVGNPCYESLDHLRYSYDLMLDRALVHPGSILEHLNCINPVSVAWSSD